MKTVDDLHLNGIKVFASEMKASKKIYDLPFEEPCALYWEARSTVCILRS
jgi:23S rRNA (guanosine2251-2'-O)-methyltransferase